MSNKGRSSSFLLIAATMFLVLMIIQSFFAPKPEEKKPQDQAAVVAPNEDANPQDVDEDDGGVPDPIRATSLEGIKTKSSDEIKTFIAAEAAPATEQDNSFINQRSFTSTKNIGQLVSIGAADAAGENRFLMTVNTLGATVRRIELNVREQSSGKYKYRDLEWTGGYLGCLDCVDVDEGVRVSIVGPGTPAAEGGIKAGDFIESLDGQNVVSVHDFERMLANTKPQTTVPVVVRRDGKSLSFDVTLTEKPIELVRPEPGVVDAVATYPESFAMTLRRPESTPQKDWDEIDQEMRMAQWEVTESGANSVAMKFELTKRQLAKLNLSGPVTVIKRFTIPELAAEDINNLESKSYHWDLDIEVINESETDQRLGFQLSGPTGTPSETWWYAQKTHGRSMAIGYIGGARDVVGSTGMNDYEFFGCPEIVKESTQTRADPKYFTNPFQLSDYPEQATINWLGVDTLYFNVSMFPKMEEGQSFVVDSAMADINGGFVPKNVREQKLVDCTFRLFKSFDVAAGKTYKQSFEVFSGPKDADLLNMYGLDDNRTFGWFWWCSKPLLSLLHFFYYCTGQLTYAIPIIILTLMVRGIMIPFSRKAALNAQMMQHLQPQMKEIADKHKDDMEKRSAAQRELFKKHDYSPLGGCWMMFIQLPIFIGLYRGLSVDIALRDQALIPGLNWCTNLSGPDQFLYWKDWFGFLGESGWFGPYLNILPLVTIVLFLVQQKLFTPPAVDDQQKMAQKMMSFMMIFMAVMFFKVPAGLCVYFITSSIWGILERKLLPKPKLDVGKLDAIDSTEPERKTGKFASILNRKEKPDQFEKARQDAAARKKRNQDRKKRLKGK